MTRTGMASAIGNCRRPWQFSLKTLLAGTFVASFLAASAGGAMGVHVQMTLFGTVFVLLCCAVYVAAAALLLCTAMLPLFAIVFFTKFLFLIARQAGNLRRIR